MNKKTLLSIVLAVSAISFAAPTFAGDVDIHVDTGAAGVLQLNLADATAIDKITLDQTNALDVVSIVGKKVEDVTVHQGVLLVAQGNAAGGLAFDPASTVAMTQTNVVNATSIDVKTVDWSDIYVGQVALGVIQGNLSIGAAGKLVDISQINAGNIVNISVNAD